MMCVQMLERCALHEKLFLTAVLMNLTRTGLTETHMERVRMWELKQKGGRCDELTLILVLSMCSPGVALLLELVFGALDPQAFPRQLDYSQVPSPLLLFLALFSDRV